MFIFYGSLFLILCITIFLFKIAESPKIKEKNLSFIMIGIAVNVFISPLSLFIGGMATDSPTSDMFDFWKGFWFIQTIPFLILLVAFIRWFIYKRRSKLSV
ncbi:hypothetical protein [Bacillus gaemokensis]|uniref:Uncharacterized protein n=1 Tax=Bacillus gaemokensis TaxID=574375 RepID=A0A073KHW9_9BACI|nr:hypothetical protein [Bacillus gaemokensis]KEK21908.1 hypothetical protein BAGA_23365 [Bacillus gaemokensis]KYG36605.1 hypothetical protein AZF08_25420 [Bacillus gaemokensis]